MSNPIGNIKHGGHGTLTYARWKSMMARCYQVNGSSYHRYGGRGITVCDQWRESFAAFLSDMGECPGREMTVERRNNDLGYSPDNCVWATKTEQNRNRSHCIELTYNGVTKILVDWAADVGMTPNTLAMRIRLGWSVERALTQPVKKRTIK